MVSGLTQFPEVPLERTYARAGRHGAALARRRAQPARGLRRTGTGSPGTSATSAEAEEWYGKWCAAPRDDLSDCAGCDPTSKASWLARQGRDEEAVALAEPVLAGRLTCSEQPQGILTTLLLPVPAHRPARAGPRRAPAGLPAAPAAIWPTWPTSPTTSSSARSPATRPAGVEILERHLGWLDRAPSPQAAMRFAAAGALVLRRAVERRHRRARVHRPAHGDRPAAEVTAVGARRPS